MRPVRVRLADGLHLHVEAAGSGPAVVLLHGFTGSAATWDGLRAALAGEFRTVAVDLIGHGASDAPADPDRYGFAACVRDLLELADRLGLRRFGLLGYSLGGRVALHLALAARERVAALVVEGAHPGIEDPGERADRYRRDLELAARLEREGIEAFAAYWEGLPLFASQRRLPEAVRERQRQVRLAQRPHGLAACLRGLSTGIQEPLWPRLGELAMPVLVVAGEEDAPYAALAREMVRRLPRGELFLVPEAGHAAHLEQPEAFARAVRGFLRRHLAAGAT